MKAEVHGVEKVFTVCMLSNLACFLLATDFFFFKNHSGIPSECQAVLDPDRVQHFLRVRSRSKLFAKIDKWHRERETTI